MEKKKSANSRRAAVLVLLVSCSLCLSVKRQSVVNYNMLYTRLINTLTHAVALFIPNRDSQSTNTNQHHHPFVMHAFGASLQHRAQPSPPDVQTQAQQREQYLEQQHVLARLARRGINPPDSWTDPHAVALTLAALQQLIEGKRQEVEAKKQQRLDTAPATPASSGSSRALATMTPTTRNIRQGVAELTLSLKAYEREIEKLQAKVREATREAEALEALAPPLVGEDGTVVDPLQVLEKVRRKAQCVLAERERIMTREEEEETASLRRGEGVSGPLSREPREEARRLVARKWMGAAGGREMRESGYQQYTEELID